MREDKKISSQANIMAKTVNVLEGTEAEIEALKRLLIEKGLITDDEFKEKIHIVDKENKIRMSVRSYIAYDNKSIIVT